MVMFDIYFSSVLNCRLICYLHTSQEFYRSSAKRFRCESISLPI